jgi:hypothetical protein
MPQKMTDGPFVQKQQAVDLLVLYLPNLVVRA